MVEANAADQFADLQYSGPAVPLEPSEEPSAFRERFDAAWERGAVDAFGDRFHPLHLINWNLQSDRNGTPFSERTTSAARHAFEKSVVYGAREAAIEQPIFLWLADRQGFLADLLQNSVGSVQEESVGALDISYRPVERSWWKRLAENGDLRYGVRPFKTDPYAFMSAGFQDGDRLLLLGNLRYHWDHFADHRFEIALSVPLAYGIMMDFGTSYRFGRHDEEKRLVVKMLKEFKGGGIVHFGFEVHEHPVLFAGITARW